MIIKYMNNHHLKEVVEEFITMNVNFHIDIYEKDLYKLLLDEGKNWPICVQPGEINLYKPRENWGWKWSTLRYLANSDEFSLFLPEPEPLATKSNVKDIQKDDEEPPVDRTELLRDLKALDIQLSKLIKKVEGGQW